MATSATTPTDDKAGLSRARMAIFGFPSLPHAFIVLPQCAIIGLNLAIPSTTPPLWSLLFRALVLGLGYIAYLRLGLHMRWSDLKTQPAAAVPAE